MEFEIDVTDFNAKMKQFDKKADAALMMFCTNQASNLQSYAQQHAPWTDRTTMARQRLKGTASRIEDGYEIELAHGVDYGIWLELAHDKKYAIVKPTVELKAPEIVEALKTLLARL